MQLYKRPFVCSQKAFCVRAKGLLQTFSFGRADFCIKAPDFYIKVADFLLLEKIGMVVDKILKVLAKGFINKEKGKNIKMVSMAIKEFCCIFAACF